MKIILTSHARTRLKERKIVLKDIENALSRPTIRKQSYPPTEIIQKITKLGTLEIVFRQTKDIYIIITAYYL